MTAEAEISNMEHVLETCQSPGSDLDEDDVDDNVTNTTDTRSTNTQETEPTQHKQREVLYENVTEVFKAIENGQWNVAHKLCKEESPELKVWVRSQGSENTTFEWSLWKRLPLHEACRQQAPVWLVSAMLQTYPEAAFMKTHFGQLPVHVAVECGASPEVLNLLVLANWEGVLQSDNSGRTPLEILVDGKNNSPLEHDDQIVVKASLERSIKTLMSIHNKCDERIKEQADAHEKEIKLINDNHEKEIQSQKDLQTSLESSLKKVEGVVQSLKEELLQMQNDTVNHEQKEQEWKHRTGHYQSRLQYTQAENAAHQEHVAALKDLVAKKDESIAKLERRIKTLQSDLVSVTVGHDDKLIGQYSQVERDLRTMLETQVKLKSRLAGHSKALHSLLKDRGIPLPEPDKTQKRLKEASPNQQPGQKKQNEETPPVAQEAANAAAAAALAALKLADSQADE